jgi:hypothetical protein
MTAGADPTAPDHGATPPSSIVGEEAAVPPAPTVAPVPPDPVAYDTERSAAARARGLSTPYIPGGRDPDQERAEREDRRYVRILLVMVIVIVLSGFVIGLLAAVAGFDFLVGNPG